jgi:hypothetical protein
MTHNTLFTSALPAVAGLLLGHLPLNAATVPTPVSGELFAAFRASGGQGGSTAYIVKLGLDTSFSTTPGTSFTLSLGNVGLDLSDIYGANWSTRADLFWGVFGTRLNSNNPIVYGSKERANPLVNSDPWPALNLSARQSVDSAIASVITAYTGATATDNSPVATKQTNSANAGSYNFQVATDGTTDFGSLSQWSSIEGSFGSGAAGTVLDVYRNASSGVTQRGSFAINNAGQLSYSVVPEPTTGVLFALAGALLVGSRHRRAVPTA